MTENKTNLTTTLPEFRKCYFQVPRSEIGYLRFITESYDGLLFLRTVDNRAAVIELGYFSCRKRDVEALLAALSVEVSMLPVAAPVSLPAL